MHPSDGKQIQPPTQVWHIVGPLVLVSMVTEWLKHFPKCFLIHWSNCFFAPLFKTHQWLPLTFGIKLRISLLPAKYEWSDSAHLSHFISPTLLPFPLPLAYLAPATPYWFLYFYLRTFALLLTGLPSPSDLSSNGSFYEKPSLIYLK